MSISQDPVFREQYAGGLTRDPEVEAALDGPNTPRSTLPPVTSQREVSGQVFFGQPVRLR